MDSSAPPVPQPVKPSVPKNIIMLLIIVILAVSIFGGALFLLIGNGLDNTKKTLGPYINKVLGFLGYTTGDVINASADIVGDTAKVGVDIAEGSVQSVGSLLKTASQQGIDVETQKKIDKLFRQNANLIAQPTTIAPTTTAVPTTAAPTTKGTTAAPVADSFTDEESNTELFTSIDDSTVEPDNTSSNIQTPSSKLNWCSVGDFQGMHGCVAVEDSARCMSGQIFPSRHLCLNPAQGH
jgi:hypothetical protein